MTGYEASEALALLIMLAQGKREIAEGRTTPVREVIARLKAKAPLPKIDQRNAAGD